MAYILSFIASNTASFAYRCRKPFLPILGETYEYIDEEHGFKSICEVV